MFHPLNLIDSSLNIMNKNLIVAILIFSTILLTGCANNPLSSYKATSDDQFSKIYAGQAKTAIQAKNTSDELFNMEYGILLRITQQYDSSNIYFARAQESMMLWANSWASSTAGQLSNNVVSMLLNDNASDYQPKGYEKSFLATFYALNHVDLNNFDNARIAIKQMYQLEEATQNYNAALYNQARIESQKNATDKTSNYLQQEIMKKYDLSDINSPQVLALKNSYQNAFSHYLAGFIFEALNEPSLARPGYVKAGQLNPTNKLIQKSIDNLDNNVRPKTGMTDLLIVEEVGHAPQLQSVEVHLPINLSLVNPHASCVNMIDVFYPKLVMDTRNDAIYAYTVDAKSMQPLPMVDVNLMSARALADEVPHIVSRNVAAAIRSIAMSQAACSVKSRNNDNASKDQLGGLLNLGSIFANALLDKADERTLTLLPNKININRINLPYGEHTITVQVNGQPHTQQIVLNQSYQIITFRIMGNNVFFDPQQSMVKT